MNSQDLYFHVLFQTCQSLVLCRKIISFQPSGLYENSSWRLATALLSLSLTLSLLSTSLTQGKYQPACPTSNSVNKGSEVTSLSAPATTTPQPTTTKPAPSAQRLSTVKPRRLAQTASDPISAHLNQTFPESFDRNPQQQGALCQLLSAGELWQPRKGISRFTETLSEVCLEVLQIALDVGQGDDAVRA